MAGNLLLSLALTKRLLMPQIIIFWKKDRSTRWSSGPTRSKEGRCCSAGSGAAGCTSGWITGRQKCRVREFRSARACVQNASSESRWPRRKLCKAQLKPTSLSSSRVASTRAHKSVLRKERCFLSPIHEAHSTHLCSETAPAPDCT